MGIELTTKEIGAEKVFYDGYCEQGIDSDISLPDYCPDIMRILKCIIHPNITNSKIVGDRASADGTAKITVVYSDEKNNICTYGIDYPFSKYAELSSAYDSASLICTCKTDYVNFRAVSKRRIDIHGVISVRFKVCGTSCEQIITSAAGNDIQLKRKGIDINNVIAVTSKTFQLSQVENVGDSLPGIGKIISYSGSPLLLETKIIKGKLLLKGELTVRIIYSSDSEANSTAVMSCNIPFNEIIESADFNENCKTDIRMKLVQISAEPKTDNDGEYRYMNISADICAHVSAFEPVCISVITDAYSTQSEIDTKYNLMRFSKTVLSFNDTAPCTQAIDISAFKPKKIYAVSASTVESKCTFPDGKIMINGKIPLSFIVIDSDGIPVFCEREAEFKYTKPIDIGGRAYSCEPQIEITGYSCNLSGDGNAEFRAELNISAFVCCSIEEKALTSLCVSDACPKKSRKSSLTIYFCSGGENLWDIARRYNTTVEEIMEENELSVDYLENKTTLMIPTK